MWKIINDELTAYRSITTVSVRDGASTSFWYDDWLPDGPLYLSHAALFSHTTRANRSVQSVFQSFDLCLRPRLTNSASAQLASLLLCLQDIILQDAPDQRVLKLTGKSFTSRGPLNQTKDPRRCMDAVFGVHVCQTKVKVFSWLYFKDRLSTRANLCAKSILDTDQCQRCSAGTQDWHHVFFVCPTSAGVWARLNMSHVAALSDVDIWNADTPPNLDAKMWPFVLQSILWRLWDARNGTIFRNEHPSSRSVSSKISDDLVIWRKRFKNDSDVHSLNSWRAYLLYCNSSNSSTVVDP